MTHRFTCLFITGALVVVPSLRAAAQEYSNGGRGPAGRGPAVLTPVEAFGVHPPGLAPADARHWRPYFPYYAPVSPVMSSTRWKPWGYAPLLPYYTPYYMGYSPHRGKNPPPRPYGLNGWGKGPMPERSLPKKPDKTPLRYAGYTSVLEDETTYWNLGGNGLVPYGFDKPFRAGAADLIDAIQSSRPTGHAHAHIHEVPSHGPSTTVTIEEVDVQPQASPRPAPNRYHRSKTKPEAIPPGVAD